MARNLEVSQEAMDLHRESVVIDLHADTPMWMRRGYDIFQRHRPIFPAAAFGFHLDVPRMMEGGLSAQLFGLVTFPLARAGMMASARAQIDVVENAAEARPDKLRVVTEAHEIEQAALDGVPAAMVSLEGAHTLEGRMENFQILADRGLRSLGLTHFSANEAGHPAFGWGRAPDRALKDFGRLLVEACNRAGVLVDLAHLNRPGFMEAVKLSVNPVIVSHTGIAGVKPLWRNIDDEQIRAVADTGGCIGVIFARNFLGGRHLDALVNHILHCLEVGGEECPALGSDFDGFVVPPKELPDVAALPRLTQALLDRGLKGRVVKKILGANALRVFREVPTKYGRTGKNGHV